MYVRTEIIIISGYTLPRVCGQSETETTAGPVIVILSPTKRPENVKLQVFCTGAISNHTCVIFNDNDKRKHTHTSRRSAGRHEVHLGRR